MFALVASASWASPAPAVVFEVINVDSPGEGFNDSTPAVPVGGNDGMTIGQQRLIAFQYAADLWGARIASDVGIRVEASFDPLQCNSFGAVLGAAGPRDAFANFAGAPRTSTWYATALANAITDSDLNGGGAEIEAFFNSNLGQPDCLAGTFFYYGLDGNEGSDIDFVTVLTHELGHGLGFLSFVNPITGQELGGFTDAFSVYLEDHSTGMLFPDMTDFERATASVDTNDLHFLGPNTMAAGENLTSGRAPSGHIRMYAPNPVEPGSSVSHWDKSLSPNKLLEPSFTGALHDIELELATLADLGYPIVGGCGDGVISGDEECDDGNRTGGDGCEADCTLLAQIVDCAVPAPVGCRFAQVSTLQVADRSNPSSDKLSWKWAKGATTEIADYGTPASETAYALCILDSGRLVTRLEVPAHAAKWQAATGRWGYRDKLGDADGVQKIKLRAGINGDARVDLRARGSNLALPAPFSPFQFFEENPSVVVRLTNSEGRCWESSFTPIGTRKNNGATFKAQGP